MKKRVYVASVFLGIALLVFGLTQYKKQDSSLTTTISNKVKTVSVQEKNMSLTAKKTEINADNDPLRVDENRPTENDVSSDDIDDATIKNVFARDIHNKHTITIFKLLQRKFTNSSDSLEDHFQDILGYLTDLLGSEKAEEVLESYVAFIRYEEGLSEQDQIWNRTQPSSLEDALALLEDIQSHRNAVFGNEATEKLFGDEIRRYEYQLRKEGIIRGENESGEDKENRIRELKKELWGKEAAFMDRQTPYARYQEKLRLYKSDFAAMTPEEQRLKRKQFRHVIFPPDVARRMDQREENRLALNK